MQIDDGTGKGFAVKVTSENRLSADSIARTFPQHINEESGEVWQVTFEGLDPTASDDLVLYVQNTGTPDLHISQITVSVTTAISQITIHEVTGTAGGSLTTINPPSLTMGSSEAPDARIRSSADITGLTEVDDLFFIQCAVVATEYTLFIPAHIILPTDGAIAIGVEAATAILTGHLTLIQAEA